jgi:hypothetical protein
MNFGAAPPERPKVNLHKLGLSVNKLRATARPVMFDRLTFSRTALDPPHLLMVENSNVDPSSFFVVALSSKM